MSERGFPHSLGRKPKGHQQPRARAVDREGSEKEPEQQTGSARWEREISGRQERSEFTMGKVGSQGQSGYKSRQSKWSTVFVRFTYSPNILSHREGQLLSVSSQGF